MAVPLANPMISLLALDLDGTLFRSDRTISERTLSALAACRARGVRVAIATARPYASVKTRVDVRLHRGVSWICGNGGSVYLDGQLLYSDELPGGTAREVLSQLESGPHPYTISMEMGGRLYVNGHLDVEGTPHEVADLVSVVDGPVAKILVTMVPYLMEPVQLPDLPSGCAVRLSDGGRAAHILSPTASKENALSALLGILDLEFSNVMAFGDDTTDIGMIQRSGVGVAMGNGVPELQTIADRVAPTNDENGVAVVLEELLATWGETSAQQDEDDQGAGAPRPKPAG